MCLRDRFDNSAMDGYALIAGDTAGASPEVPVTLRVLEHIGAGDWPAESIALGTASRIMTGAPMPEGADAVVMVEYTVAGEADGGVGGTVAVQREATAGDHVRRRGEEVLAGAVVLAAGEVLGPAGIGLLAATGNPRPLVYRRPRVAIVPTGSELVDASEKPGPGQIRNSNSYSLAAQVLDAGGVPLQYAVIPDDEAATREAFERAAAEADFIVTSGGVSVGDFDFVKPVLEQIGELEFCKVAMRPGNPQTLGTIRGVPFFGLPGNPTSTFVGFEVFVRPALLMMQGLTELDRPHVVARLTHDVKKRQDRRYYLRARLTLAEDEYQVELSGSQSSALLTAAHRGNCFMVLPEGTGMVPAGTEVVCMRLDVKEGTR
ncbi:MAG: molybdopterin molybdotransferase MoeA [Actinobacteria bacterium]|nr:MAG: molybdopterin molybdotransferase MoeA [Actinomycetota bacterium]